MMGRRKKATRSDEEDLPDTVPSTFRRTVKDRDKYKRRSKSTSQLEDLKTGSGTVLLSDEPDKWCIYRVPSKLRNVNKEAYTPQLVSIGPFHHGKAELQDMQSHKKKYMDYFFERTLKDMGAVRSFIEDLKNKIRHCYAGTIELGDIDLVEMILVDACFIIELFLMKYERENGDDYTKDYILSSPWVWKAAEQDLILFENQLPYFLLQELFDFAFGASSISHPVQEIQSHKSSTNNKRNCFQKCFPCYCGIHPNDHHVMKMEHDESEPELYHDNFLELACNFFNNYSEGKSVKVKPKHFTDLIRHFMCPEKEKMLWEKNTTNSIYCMRKLTTAGVNFMPFPKDGRFVVKKGNILSSLTCFKTMDLKLSQICVKDETECIIRNVMAAEQFLYPDDAFVCNYFLLMDKLVDTVEDVEFLIRQKVIVNMLGSEEAVVNLVNHLCDHILEERSCYVHICEKLNEHYENSWNRHVSTLRRVYFKDLWTSSSTFFGIVVLVFSIIGSIKSFK